MSKYTVTLKADRAELMIYGDIGKDFFAEESNDAKTITSTLAEIADKPLDVRIFSEGGSAFEAVAIYNALQRHPSDVHVHVDGLAASAASIIAMAGNKISMAANADMMIHAPKMMAAGDENAMQEAKDMLARVREKVIPMYARAGGVDTDKIRAWLLDGQDHWLTAEEAVEMGLADEITDALDIAASLDWERRFTQPILGKTNGDSEMAEPTASADKTQDRQDDFLTKHKSVVAKSTAKGASQEHARIRAIQAEFDGFTDDPDGDMAGLLDACLDDQKCTVDMARKRIIAMLRDETDVPIPAAAPDRKIETRRIKASGQAAIVTDETDKFVTGATEALMVRSGLEKDGEVIAQAGKSEFLSMSMIELCKHSLRLAGQPVNGNETDIARRVVMAGPGQGTDHFPAILENLANKSVMDGYLGAEETWNTWTQQGTLNDYRTASRVNKSLFDTLDKMEEYEPFRSGRFADVKQSITGYLHGKSFSLTLQAIVNDDLSLLSEDARAWGEAANVTIGDAVFVALTAAGTGGYGQSMDEDSTILFHADHSNYIASGSGAAPSSTTISAGRTAMMTQTDPNSRTVASRPRYLLHGTPLTMGVFTLLNSQSMITGADTTVGERNPVASLGLMGVEEYRMDDFVSTAWILAAARRTVEVSFVGGQSTPSVTRMPPGEIPGVSWQISIPFGVAALDYRTLYLNYGA